MNTMKSQFNTTRFRSKLHPFSWIPSNHFKSFQSVDLLPCSPSILLRKPKLPHHLDLPHPPGISNKLHQSLPNIPDVIVLMQELGIAYACGIVIVPGITNG
jgi:hypothetical protein